jgi:competence protein ComEC
VPLLGLALPALFASLVLAPVPALAGVAADAAVALLMLLRTVAEVSAAPGWAALEVPPIGLGMGAVLAVLAWLVLGVVRGPSHRARAIVGVGAAAACWIVAPVVVPLLHRGGHLEIVALDVGQGDAIALRTPAGRWILVDAGLGGVRGDAGARVVVPYLRSRGVRSLEALLLSHPHADHIGGAPAVLERMRVRRVLDPGHVAGGAAYTRVLERLAHDEVEVLLPRAGDWAALDGLRIHFLGPSDSLATLAADPNDASLWFVLTYGEFRAAFTGDASSAVETVAARAAGPVTLLKVAHHGSTTASGPEALSVLRPQVAIVSAGRRNRYGHPHLAVLDRLERSGAEVRRTDREGTIHLQAWPSGRVRVRRP